MNRHVPDRMGGLDWAAAVVTGIILLLTAWAIVGAMFAIGEGP